MMTHILDIIMLPVQLIVAFFTITTQSLLYSACGIEKKKSGAA